MARKIVPVSQNGLLTNEVNDPSMFRSAAKVSDYEPACRSLIDAPYIGHRPRFCSKVWATDCNCQSIRTRRVVYMKMIIRTSVVAQAALAKYGQQCRVPRFPANQVLSGPRYLRRG